MPKLIEALQHDNIFGIALDHYQYLHYKSEFPKDLFHVDFHASAPITVGLLLAAENASAPLFEGTPIQQCLYRQAVFGMWTLEDELMASLNHTREFVKTIQFDMTSDNFFGKTFKTILAIITIVLLCILLISALLFRNLASPFF